MNEASISVVIVSYNTKNYLQSCISSVLDEIDTKRDEIHVVDNCSQDGSGEMVKQTFPSINLHQSGENLGFSFGCNKGFNKSKGDFILFCNGDVFFPPNSIDRIRKKMMADHKIGILSPELIGPEGQLCQMTWGWDISLLAEIRQKILSPQNIVRWSFINHTASWLQRKDRNVGIVAGACMLVRAQMLRKIGGLDENFVLYFEDSDLCLRCRQAGYTVYFTPSAKVIHQLGKSGEGSPKNISLIYRQSQIFYYRKHHSKIELSIIKMYLWIKFLLSRPFWKDTVFRIWIINILRERSRLILNDSRILR